MKCRVWKVSIRVRDSTAPTVKSHTRWPSYTTVIYMQRAYISPLQAPWLLVQILCFPMRQVLNRRLSNGRETLKELFNILSQNANQEMQIQTTLRFNLTPVRMSKIKNKTTNNSLCSRRCRARATLPHLFLMVVQTCTAVLEINTVVSQKIGNRFP